MARDVTLQATYAELVGDETYELWLKKGSNAWALRETGDVAPDISSHQNFVLLGLESGTTYVAQIRLKRAGRYRVGYLTGNPDTWPSNSRVSFTPGALEGVGAPTINTAVWSRTSADHQRITLSIDAESLDVDMIVYRNGVSLGTIPAPHTNPVTFVDNDPPIAQLFAYTARHTAGFLDGPLSDPVDCFSGPLPLTGVAQTSSPTLYGEYTIGWTNDGDLVHLQDDFLCATEFVDIPAGSTSGGTSTTAAFFVRDNLPVAGSPGGTQSVDFNARARREVTSFSVTDVSDWVEAPIVCLIDDTNADFNSCP